MNPQASHNQKRQLRRAMSKKRQSLEGHTHQQASEKASQHLIACWRVRRSQKVAFYAPFKGELSPLPAMNDAIEADKTCYLPILDPLQPHFMHFGHYNAKRPTTKNRLGIQEPELGQTALAPPWTLDVVAVPLLAFDKAGYRLGWGGGFYDATFSYIHEYPDHPRPWLIGFAYSWQKTDSPLPHEAHDIALDQIVTELGVMGFSR